MPNGEITVRYHVEHETRLVFDHDVQEHQCELRLRPRADAPQTVSSFVLETDPPAPLFTYEDAFGNQVDHFGVTPAHRTLVTRVRMDVETSLDNPFNYFQLQPAEEHVWYRQRLADEPNLWQYILHESDATPKWSKLDPPPAGAPQRDPEQPVQHSLLAAMRWVLQTLQYRSGVTDTHTPLVEVLAQRAGVCQDFAHLFLCLIRSWGIPARYVMGYVDTGLLYASEDAGEPASHAWVEVLIPNAGWRGFDATHGLVVNDRYIPVAVGRDSKDAAPQRGSFKGNHAGPAPLVKVVVSQQQ